ncbi:LOW QUALITY PROTEIN: huntingtin-like [Dendronephthya gigantea]|uniref:LOW QUALITY PROTEIN: huntingtin-like n=1 Tax=Dendronephthya gigantea TaxID=151771 RepID=UPI00106BCF43|nr:LOW QUALITY PROTEIN: huntingtin-like [Dendronephthya gigantea]
MSLAVADKLLRAFEALKNFKDGTSNSDPNVAVTVKKKESTLSKKDRITNLNIIGDLTCSPLLRNLGEFGKLIAVSIETLLSFCDDPEPDVRLVAGDCINRITKGFMDSNVARIHVELYKEIKKNGNSRCLRAALSKFTEICYLIRPHKCRPFITNLLPCLARICSRPEESVQETLAIAMKRMMPVLGAFMNDKETKILLKTFLQNVHSTSAQTRRTSASSITMICLHARKPSVFFSWVINILLESMLPFSVDQNSPAYCGALLCLRHIVPHLGNEEQENEVVMRGSFGVIHQQKRNGSEEMLEKEEKQLLQMYKLVMLSTKHCDHNVVTAGLEALQQLLQSPPRKLLYQLMSQQGLAAFSNKDRSESFLSTSLEDIDSLSFASQQDSGIEEPLSEMSVDGGSVKDGEMGTSVADIQELRRHFSQPEDSTSVGSIETASEISENGVEGSSSVDTESDSNLGHHRSDSNTSGILTQASSTDELDRDEKEQEIIAMDDQEPEFENDESKGVDDGFNIDPVVCEGVPLLHCARVMCSFLLSGKSGEILSDRKVRVSVKSLALNCLGAIFKIYPQVFLARVLPAGEGEETGDESYQQMIREVLLYVEHHDPTIRGSLAVLLGNFINSSLVRSRYDFETWSSDVCDQLNTDHVKIDDLLGVLEKILLDDSSFTVKLACLGVQQCLPALCLSSYTTLTLQLCLKLVRLKQNSYWLVKCELLQIIGNLNYSLIAFLEKQASCISSEQSTKTCFNLQQTFFRDVLLELLADDDPRVRSEATETIVKLVRNMHVENEQPLIAIAKRSLRETFGSSYGNENFVIKANLARVVTSLSQKLNVATSKHSLLGYCEALSSLSKSYPVPSWPVCWSCDVHAITRSPSPTGKTGFTGHVFPSASSPNEPLVSSILCNNGGGSLSFVIELMTSSWLTFNLHGHEDALLLVGNLLIGIASSSLTLGHSDVSSTESPGKWSVFADLSIAALADKVFVHVLRLLNICFHVIDNVTPGAHSAKPSLLSKDKDKSSAPIPGAAVPTSNPTSTAPNIPGSKRLLNRSRRNTETDAAGVGGEKGSTGKGSDSEGKSSTTGTLLGQFHHLPHYHQLYEVIKGVFSNYKVNLKFNEDDKFVKLLKTILTVFAMLLEIVTFSDIGKNVEEIISYLQATVKCDPATTFLCVQQMLRAIFGVNVATQPESCSSNSPYQKDALITDIQLPSSLEVLVKNSGDAGFYHSYFEGFQQELTRTFEEIRKSDNEAKESKSFKDFGFIKRLRERRSSFRPPLKVDKQVHIHTYIRMFEPLVIQALKEYTSSSDIRVQAQVLSILVQLIRLRVNYALLDSEQAFLNFVLKQFEFIEAGQIRHIETFSPHIFQFLILLSYECFQPKFNQAKSVFGMSRIIQVCDDLMACGQSARTHAIPALCPIVYDLFDTQATGRNENTKELETQREVFISMLLRLAQFPEVLNLLVYVLTFYRKNDEKWKKFSRQAVDITLQMLIKQQVIIDDMEGLKSLENLFDSVAPIALRPLDVILKAIFAPAILPSTLLMKRWLSQVIVLLKVIVTHSTEENLLSRITQLGFTGGLTGNIMDDEELDVSNIISESNPARVMAYFLFRALYLAVKNSSMVADLQDQDGVEFISQQTSSLMLYIQEITRSGLFKNLSRACSDILKEHLVSGDKPSQAMETIIKRIHEICVSIKETQPVLCLQWIQLVFLFEFDNDAWWRSLQGEMMSQKRLSVNGHISLKGTFLVCCKILTTQLKQVEDTSEFQNFLEGNLLNIIEMAREPPVKMLLRQIHSSSTCSQAFIVVVKGSCRNTKSWTKHSLEFRKNLLVILDDLHYKQSNDLIQLLIADFLNSHYRAITRKCETMICSRLEYCMSLPKEEFEEFFSSEDIKGIHNSLVAIGVTKRNPRLASLISHLSPEPFSVTTVENTIDCKAAISALKTKQTINVSWFYSFVHNCCCSGKMNEVVIKSCSEVVHLLHALSFEKISAIMDEEKFNTTLLSPCLAFGIKKTIEISSRKFDHETPNSPFEDTAYFDNYGVDHLFQCSFGLLLRHVQEIVFCVTTFDENNEQEKRTENSEQINLIKSTINSSQMDEFSQNFAWRQRLLEITKALDVYLAMVDKLPMAAQLPKAIYCAVCQFSMIALEVLCQEQCRYCCTSELATVLRCFSQILHSQHLHCIMNSTQYSSWVCNALRSVYCLVRRVFVHPGATLPEDKAYDDLVDSDIPLKQASMLVNYLYTFLNHSHHSSVPDTLTRLFRDAITGLSRLTIFNSYVRIPPLVWKMGWAHDQCDKELPPLPIDILREKDVLQDFVLRVHSIGWISRQQFEETWAALLGVLSSPLSPEQTSREEDIDSVKSGCLALQCITALLLQTTLCPSPGNPSIGTNLHTSRQKELPFLDSRAGKKLSTVRKIVEDHFIQQCPQSSTWQTNVDGEKLYGGNIERVSGLQSYSLGQICISSLQSQCVPVDTGEFSETNATSTNSTQEKIDVRSCVQFLMELFEQWVSPYTQPKTPLMLLTQSVKSLLIISDLFVDSAQYEWMLSELLDLCQNYLNEDEILMQYLLPALCKALAVLKMEGVIPEKVVKIMETAFKAPHVPLQVSGLYGALYLLESHTTSVTNLVIPLVTDYVLKVSALVTDSSVFGEHRLLATLSISFYMLEHYGNEIPDLEFKGNFLTTVLTMASSGDENIPLHLYHAIIRGLERLVVSFSLSREDSDSLVKFSVDRLAMRNPQKAISALGLLLTCMYTGKEGDRPGGLFSENAPVDTPTDDVLLLALERVTALFDRIRKGFRSEAKLVSEILPIVLSDFFSPTDMMNKVIGEFLSSQQPYPELMACVLYKVCEHLISKGQQSSVKDWILLSLSSFTQRPPLGMAVWSFTCVFIAASTNRWIRALFQHVVSRIGKLENIDRTYFLITATDFYHNQNLTEDEKKSFFSTFEKVSQAGTPYAELTQNID